jgi:hypothetical protein
VRHGRNLVGRSSRVGGARARLGLRTTGVGGACGQPAYRLPIARGLRCDRRLQSSTSASEAATAAFSSHRSMRSGEGGAVRSGEGGGRAMNNRSERGGEAGSGRSGRRKHGRCGGAAWWLPWVALVGSTGAGCRGGGVVPQQAPTSGRAEPEEAEHTYPASGRVTDPSEAWKSTSPSARPQGRVGFAREANALRWLGPSLGPATTRAGLHSGGDRA